MIYKDYINHNSFGQMLKHNELPVVVQAELRFYRYVTFTDDMYGKTVSELHQGNLRTVTVNNRYADLFEGNKVSYWAATPLIARREWKKHNQEKTNHLMFWAYDDISSTFPTIRESEPLVIIDGIQLGFEKILEKCDRGEPLTAQDKLLIDRIKETKPDCLAYKPHTSKKNNSDDFSIVCEANFMFFEKGFRKLSLRKVDLRLNKGRNKNDICCIKDGDYTPCLESYGEYFAPIAKIKMSKEYLKTDEYLLRKSIYEKHKRNRFTY